MQDLGLTVTLKQAGSTSQVEYPSIVVRVVTPDGAERRVSLGLHPLTIGTSPEADLVVDAPGVSRRHCEVTRTAQGVRVKDLQSKNGTRVGGVRIESAFLEEGVAVEIGQAHLSIVREGPRISIPISLVPRFGEAVGLSVPMRALFAVLQRVAPKDESLLLLGESGTGKELLARAVHDGSPRRAGPFVVVDCGAISPTLVEAELFGYQKGAFTGAATAREGLLAQGDGGTLFLDEIGDLPLDLQPKLLRALEARQVRPLGGNAYRRLDVRVVAATHRDLRAMVAAGRFREDLYYRLAVVEARVPPLRERPEDIPLLVEAFLRESDEAAGASDLPAAAMAMLQSHHWPGNVRELRNAVSRLRLFPDQLGLGPTAGAASGRAAGGAALIHLPLREARELVVSEFERTYLSAQLSKHGSTPAAAKAMGVSRQLVHRMVRAYGLDESDE